MSNYKNIILKSSQRGLKLWHFSGSSEPQLFSKKSSCLLQVIDVRTCLPELALFRYFATKNQLSHNKSCQHKKAVAEVLNPLQNILSLRGAILVLAFFGKYKWQHLQCIKGPSDSNVYFIKRQSTVSPSYSKTATMRRGSKKKPLSQTVEEYASRTSIHGISYIFDRQGQFLKHPS